MDKSEVKIEISNGIRVFSFNCKRVDLDNILKQIKNSVKNPKNNPFVEFIDEGKDVLIGSAFLSSSIIEIK